VRVQKEDSIAWLQGLASETLLMLTAGRKAWARNTGYARLGTGHAGPWIRLWRGEGPQGMYPEGEVSGVPKQWWRSRGLRKGPGLYPGHSLTRPMPNQALEVWQPEHALPHELH